MKANSKGKINNEIGKELYLRFKHAISCENLTREVPINITNKLIELITGYINKDEVKIKGE